MADRREVAEYLGVSAHTLAIWAMKEKGPRYRRIGRSVRYDWADVLGWVQQQEAVGGAA